MEVYKVLKDKIKTILNELYKLSAFKLLTALVFSIYSSWQLNIPVQ